MFMLDLEKRRLLSRKEDFNNLSSNLETVPALLPSEDVKGLDFEDLVYPYIARYCGNQ